MMILDVALG